MKKKKTGRAGGPRWRCEEARPPEEEERFGAGGHLKVLEAISQRDSTQETAGLRSQSLGGEGSSEQVGPVFPFGQQIGAQRCLILHRADRSTVQPDWQQVIGQTLFLQNRI